MQRVHSLKKISKIFPDQKGAVRIIPLGGCGQFGMNSTLLLYEGKSYLIDAGVLFSEEWALGTSSIILDLNFIMSQIGSLTAYIITHGHEDHVGALAYQWQKYPAPIYTTPWTKELFLRKLARNFPSVEIQKIYAVKMWEKLMIGNIANKWIQLNHSIPHACSLKITTPDFKIIYA